MSKWNGNNGKPTDPLAETATLPMTNPGEYPIGSLQSRAAARAMLKEKKQEVIKIHFVASDGNGHPKIPGTPLPEKPFKVHYWPDGSGRTDFYRDEDDRDEQ